MPVGCIGAAIMSVRLVRGCMGVGNGGGVCSSAPHFEMSFSAQRLKWLQLTNIFASKKNQTSSPTDNDPQTFERQNHS